jgi:hypothetical protein
MKIRPLGNELFHAEGRTDIQAVRKTEIKTNRHGKTNYCFSHFYERAWKLVVIIVVDFGLDISAIKALLCNIHYFYIFNSDM